MRTPAKLIGVAKLAAVALVALTTFGQAAQFAQRGQAPEGDGRGTASARLTPGFHVRGHITHLYPGKHARLTLRISNPNRFPIAVRRIRVSVGNPPGCSGRNLVIEPYRGRRRVLAHRTVRLRLRTWMRPRTPDACQGDRFRLMFHGVAARG